MRYADFAERQRARLAGKDIEQQLEYWQAQLTDLPALDLPGDRPRPVDPTSEGDPVTVEGTALLRGFPLRALVDVNIGLPRCGVPPADARRIAHAILDAYSVASNRERSAEVHLFL